MVWFGSEAPGQGRHQGRGSRFVGVALVLAAVVAACGGGTSTPASIAVPSQTFDANNPNTKIWPTGVISATISLAALDNEIKKAGEDLTKAADTADTVLMLGAAEGLVNLVTPSVPNAQKLAGYEETKAAGEAYLKALTAIRTSASELAKALRAGDSAGVTTSAQALGQAMTLYGQARPLIVDLVNKALEMQKHLLR